MVNPVVMILADEEARKKLGWIIVAVLSPIILVLALFCSLASASQYSDDIIDLVFSGGPLPGSLPEEYALHIQAMRECLNVLDTAILEVNDQMETGTLDSALVKSVFYTLYFGRENLPLLPEDARAFADCFVRYENRVTPDGETTAAVAVSKAKAYENLTALGFPDPEQWAEDAEAVYKRIAYGSGGDGLSGSVDYGGAASTRLDIALANPSRKNAADLVRYAENAWRSGWGYVWGTFGQVLTEDQFAYKLRQYPDGVGRYKDFIQKNWLGRRTADCVGLIKSYGWLDPNSMTIRYGTNGMPDIGADAMYRNATVKGPISTIPEVPGLAVWHSGHIGIYIGNGGVIEAMGTKYGVVRTQLSQRNFTHWLQIPYINYD